SRDAFCTTLKFVRRPKSTGERLRRYLGKLPARVRSYCVWPPNTALQPTAPKLGRVAPCVGLPRYARPRLSAKVRRLRRCSLCQACCRGGPCEPAIARRKDSADHGICAPPPPVAY